MTTKKTTFGAIGALACTMLPFVPLGASAQSSVQLYGVVDMGVSSYKGDGAGSRQMVTSGGNQASRLGFRGREDLGSGLVAGFDMESGINADTGTGQLSNTNNQASGNSGGGGLTFNRKSFVYLQSKQWGELRLGRDYTPAFWNTFLFDPFRVGVGASTHVLHGTTVTGFRASNSVGYFSPGCSGPSCQGFFYQGMVAFGENGAGPDRQDGNLYGLRVGYGGEQWNAAAAVTTTRNRIADDYTSMNIAASYLWNGHRFMALAAENRTGNRLAAVGNANRVRYWQLGAEWKVGNGSIPMSFMRLTRNDGASSSSQKYAVGYVHNLSKRTALYGTYAYVDNRGSINLPVASGAVNGPIPTAGGNASGFDIGMRHSF